jgi:hypothetical protein
MDHLLDPLDTLRAEFHDEAARAALTETTGRPTYVDPRTDRFGVSSLSLAERLRYSRRAPYRQIRMGLWGVLYVTSICVTAWAVVRHT